DWPKISRCKRQIPHHILILDIKIIYLIVKKPTLLGCNTPLLKSQTPTVVHLNPTIVLSIRPSSTSSGRKIEVGVGLFIVFFFSSPSAFLLFHLFMVRSLFFGSSLGFQLVSFLSISSYAAIVDIPC
ncbi:hypothetical protein LINGRAHAP2_LOCUS30852, partial [Linum grandiflorum]